MIGNSEAPDRSSKPSDPPEVILVEITVHPAHTTRFRMATISKVARWPVGIALALLVAILAATVVLPGGQERGQQGLNAMSRQSGPAGVAAAYGYPLRCLSITMLAAGRRYARADFNHASLCGRFTGDPTAIFLRAAGAWRPVIEAVDYVCPVASLPLDVQTELAVCPEPIGRAAR